MPFSKGSIITASDVQALKAVIANECSGSRRGRANGTSQNQSNGTLSGYYSSVNNFTPRQGSKITASEANTLYRPTYYAKNGSESVVSVGQLISMEDLSNQIYNLASKSITSSDHGCSGACTGLCFGGCYSACTSCTGSCSGGCYNGCLGTCRGSCTGNCSGGCQGCDGCSGSNVCQNCNGNCSGCWSCSGRCEQVG